MRQVIEIDENIYESAKEMSETSIDEYKAMRAIANSTPLESVFDDIKAEIAEIIKLYEGSCDQDLGIKWGYEGALEIINEHTKAGEADGH